jgi:hypothetical protein
VSDPRFDDPNRILSHGLELGRLGKSEVEFLENIPGLKGVLSVCSIPMPRKAWRVYADHFRRKAQKAQTMEMTERWRVCERTCKVMWHGAHAMDALIMLTELEEETGNKWCDAETRGMFRDEHHFMTHKEWLGRDIG